MNMVHKYARQLQEDKMDVAETFKVTKGFQTVQGQVYVEGQIITSVKDTPHHNVLTLNYPNNIMLISAIAVEPVNNK